MILGAIQELRNEVGLRLVKFSGEKRYKGVPFNDNIIRGHSNVT